MTNILVLGAGFGGVSAALKLEKKLRRDFSASGGPAAGWKITLLDRNNFHLFTPSLYEVATIYGLIEDDFNRYLRGSVAIPINEILKDKKINFVQAEIKEINLKEKFVATGGGAKLDFDYLVIALGGETEFYAIPGVRDYAFNFRRIDDAIAIYKKIQELYSEFRQPRSRRTEDRRNWGRQGAERPSEGGETPSETRIAVIGGGFTGVELAAELGCCVKNIIKACKLNKDCTKISLFEAGPTILLSINEKSRKVIEKRLKKVGVEIQTNSPVIEVGSDYIKIGDRGEVLNFDLVLWAGGVRGSRLLESLNLKLTEKNTIEINEFLQAKNSDESINEKTFAIGDSAAFLDPRTQKPTPAMAYIAHDEADIAAENIIRAIRKQNLKSYKPFYDVWVAPVGGKWAYFYYKGISLAGFKGYLLRQLVDFKYFLRILPLNKALALFFKDLVIFTRND